MKKVLALLVASLFVCSVCFAIVKQTNVQVIAQNSNVGILVDPAKVEIDPLQGFQIKVVVENVSDLYAWEFKLFYKRDNFDGSLMVTSIQEGPALNGVSKKFWASAINNYYNSTHGMVRAGWSLLGNVSGFTGKIVLAILNCVSLSPGESTIALSDITLLDSKVSIISPLTKYDGLLIVGAKHPDIAVISVEPLRNYVIKGLTLGIKVQVKNTIPKHILDENETFTVSLYYNSTHSKTPGNLIDTVTVTNLEPLETRTLLFNWSTVDVISDNYTITAYATPVPNEVNKANNSATSGVVFVPIIGDIWGPDGFPDGVVDMFDIANVARHYPSAYPDSRYCPECDINFDKLIDIKDIATIANLT